MSWQVLHRQRQQFGGGRCALLYGATNEGPRTTMRWALIFDRFLVRTLSERTWTAFTSHGLVERGIRGEIRRRDRGRRRAAALPPGQAAGVTCPTSAKLRRRAWGSSCSFPEEFLARYKGFNFQIRSGSGRERQRPARIQAFPKQPAASAILDGRTQVNDGDFFILKHVWNSG